MASHFIADSYRKEWKQRQRLRPRRNVGEGSLALMTPNHRLQRNILDVTNPPWKSSLVTCTKTYAAGRTRSGILFLNTEIPVQVPHTVVSVVFLVEDVRPGPRPHFVSGQDRTNPQGRCECAPRPLWSPSSSYDARDDVIPLTSSSGPPRHKHRTSSHI